MTFDWAVAYANELEENEPLEFSKPAAGWYGNEELGIEGVRTDEVTHLIVYEVGNPSNQYLVSCTDEGTRPIFYETVILRVKQNVDEQGRLVHGAPSSDKVTVFGWQKTVNGVNVKSLVRIMNSDGSVWIGDHDPEHAK